MSTTIADMVWNTYIQAGSAAYQAQHYGLAQKMLRAAANEGLKLDKPPATMAAIYENLAGAYCHQKRYGQVERLYLRCLDLYESSHGKLSQARQRICCKLAEVCIFQSRLKRAHSWLKQAIELKSIPA